MSSVVEMSKKVRKGLSIRYKFDKVDGDIEVPVHPKEEVQRKIGEGLIAREVCPLKGWDQDDFVEHAKITWM